ncbi:MAG: ABC transporter permease [Actinomycetota bacterium]
MALVDAELSGLDHLEIAEGTRRSPGARLWAAVWPKLAAIAIAVTVWQVVFLSGWREPFVLPAPATVLRYFVGHLGTLVPAALTTLQRGLTGFAIALVLGTLVGALVSRSRVLRSAVGSMITGLQTMPSIAWFPLAILIFKLSEAAIMFVVVLGAAPAIANGLISGADHIPPILLRAGRVLGARGFACYRYIVLPGSMPGFVGGLKQGWAFAWRSLMAGELIVIIAGRQSIGSLLQINRNLNDAEGLMAMMVVILVIGIAVDSLVFGRLERSVRRRFGLEG